MSRIPLHARDGAIRAYAIVDPEDFAALSAYRWSLDSKGYARRWEATGKGKRRSVAMHRQILGLAQGDPREGDHVHGDRLDNRRAHLRVVTHAENTQNVRQLPGRSGHRNVYWHHKSGLWRVQLRSSERLISGGYFALLEDAVAAATALRREHLPFAVEVAA